MNDTRKPRQKQKFFSIDARAMLTWGRDSIKDHTTALLELVKNSYDAAATVVHIEIMAPTSDTEGGYIRVTDDGHGMTEDEVDNYWLRIGYSEKLANKRTTNRRRKTGEKGIGRISADRLGAILDLQTQAKDAEPVALLVHWDRFDSQGTDLDSVPIEVTQETGFSVPRPSHYNKSKRLYEDPPSSRNSGKKMCGTQLTMRHLRQRWNAKDIQNLRQELASLTPPFKTVRDFQIRIETNIAPDCNGVVESPFYETAEIEARFTYRRDHSVTYLFKARDPVGKQAKPEEGQLPWMDFVHAEPPPDDENASKDGCGPDIGIIEIRLLFYPRRGETLRGTDLRLGQLRSFLNANAGIKVYRDNIRVLPYGIPDKAEGDWLALGDRKAREPAGPARAQWRVAPNQLVGAVFLSRDNNPGLIDTSGREGLVQGDAFNELRQLLMGCIIMLEGHYHTLFVRRKAREKEPLSPREVVAGFKRDLRTLSDDLQEVEKALPRRGEEEVQDVRRQIRSTTMKIETLAKSMDELASQATVYRGLATLGITAATFAHETETQIQGFLDAAQTARNVLGQSAPDVATALREIGESIAYGERIMAWGIFALERIKRDKRRRRKINVSRLVETLVSELQPTLEASHIHVQPRFGIVDGRMFPMDVESVVLNLVANAYYFAKLNHGKRTVRIETQEVMRDDRKGVEIVVADSGPGVPQKNREMIWEELFSTKVNQQGKQIGTGLGLSIVRSVVADLGGTADVSRDPQLKGARFEIWLPLG